VFLLTLLLLEQKLKLVGIVRKLVYLLALLCFAVLAVTGFYSPLVSGKPIGGYLLMLHATFAPVLAGCLAILAVMWADNCRLDKNYWPWLQKLLQRETPDKTAGEKYELGQKLSFWIIVFLALPLILSIDASMLPFFGTDWQELLLNAHRYSALLLTLVVIIHIYLTVLARARK